MDDTTLLALLGELESELTERKESAADLDRIAKAICAFSNDLPGHRKPGVVFIGVSDADGTPCGLTIDDRLQTRISNLVDDGRILPQPRLSLRRLVTPRGEVLAVVVEPHRSPPVRFGGVTWIRVGPTTRRASPYDEATLFERRRAADGPFDASPVDQADLNDLDLQRFRDEYLPAAVAPDVLAENERSVEHQLTSLRLYALELAAPTVAGVLVLGRDPQRHFPGAYVQFLRIQGRELGDPVVDQYESNGPLADLVRQLQGKLAIQNRVAADLTSSIDRRPADYPEVAVQQIVRNAIMHRTYQGTNSPVRVYWYDDRIEVYSPGGPYGHVHRENFGEPGVTDYRNPVLAEAMRVLGFVQQFGFGIALARRAMAAGGNPPIEFDVQPSHILATLRRRP